MHTININLLLYCIGWGVWCIRLSKSENLVFNCIIIENMVRYRNWRKMCITVIIIERKKQNIFKSTKPGKDSHVILMSIAANLICPSIWCVSMVCCIFRLNLNFHRLRNNRTSVEIVHFRSNFDRIIFPAKSESNSATKNATDFNFLDKLILLAHDTQSMKINLISTSNTIKFS